MSELLNGMFYSRRGFLSLLAAAGVTATLPASLIGAADVSGDGEAVEGVDADDLRPLAELMPDGYEAHAVNPNFRLIWDRIVAPPVRSDDDDRLLWVERRPDGELSVKIFEPETELERADAREIYEVYNHRAWRTFDDLRRLVRGKPGPWVVRQTLLGRPLHLLCRNVAPQLLGMERIDLAWWEQLEDSMTTDLNEAALLNGDQVLRLVPRLAAMLSPDDESCWAYEPVTPANAFKDLRVLQLRTSGWAPQVGQAYDLDALAETFSPGKPIVLPEPHRHPFVQVADGWLALVDYGGRPGRATIDGARGFSWHCRCAAAESGEACACVPGPMRENAETQFIHLFVRAAATGGPYAYIGLGHLPPGEHGWGLMLHVVPSIEAKFFRSLGGDLAWAASGQSADGDWLDYGELSARPNVDRVLSATREMRAGSIYFHRWGPDGLELRVFGDHCIARFREGAYENAAYKFLTDPAFAGENGGAPFTLSDEMGDMETRADAVLPRLATAILIEQLAAADVGPPGDYARWKMIERPEPPADEETPPSDEGAADQTDDTAAAPHVQGEA